MRLPLCWKVRFWGLGRKLRWSQWAKDWRNESSKAHNTHTPKRIWLRVQNHRDGGVWLNEFAPEPSAEMNVTVSKAITEGRLPGPGPKKLEKVAGDGVFAV